MKAIYHFGKYAMLMRRALFVKAEKRSIYMRQFFREVDNLGIGSLGIVMFISVFMGGVITIQSAFGFTSAFVPLYAVGLTTRDSIILEFSPTIVSLIMAGNIGSKIASELGTMRISEQVDALEIMGINSAGYLIRPKILATMLFNPFLIIISMFFGVFGGYVIGVMTGVVTPYEYVYGIQYDFVAYKVVYSLIKTVVFGFIISSVSAYHGFYTEGGALEVGKSSTRAVVYSSVLILVSNLVLTQIMLS
jgi:phospholipid/cholesterol/gamma-HCH transport system permease protein